MRHEWGELKPNISPFSFSYWLTWAAILLLLLRHHSSYLWCRHTYIQSSALSLVFFTLELFRRRTLDCENKGGTMVAASMAKFWHVLSIRPAVVVSGMVLVVRYANKTFSSLRFFGEKSWFKTTPPTPNEEELFFPWNGEWQAYRIWKYETRRIWEYKFMRIWEYESMRKRDYENMRVWNYENMGI